MIQVEGNPAPDAASQREYEASAGHHVSFMEKKKREMSRASIRRPRSSAAAAAAAVAHETSCKHACGDARVWFAVAAAAAALLLGRDARGQETSGAAGACS